MHRGEGKHSAVSLCDSSMELSANTHTHHIPQTEAYSERTGQWRDRSTPGEEMEGLEHTWGGGGGIGAHLGRRWKDRSTPGEEVEGQ